MKRIFLVAVGLLLVLLLARRPQPAVPVEVTRVSMGTLVTVKLYRSARSAGPLIERAFAEIDRIDSLMSRYIDESEVNRLERAAVDSFFICSPEMGRVLQRSQLFARSTSGAFDVTIGALTRLWNFPDAVVPPPAGRIDSALALVGYQNLQVAGRQVRLVRSGVRLDLGGAAKGFAVDQAAELLRELGADCGLIEAGGDIRYWGKKPDGRSWKIYLQHPRKRDSLIAVEELELPAVATSGDYEQFFEHGGKRYHHILDPSTGYPADRAISATVWAGTALDADILSTAVFILGPEQGIAIVERLPEAEALVFFEKEGRLYHLASSGVEGSLRFSNADN